MAKRACSAHVSRNSLSTAACPRFAAYGDTVRVRMRDDEEDFYDLPHLACGMRGRAKRLREDIVQQSGVRWVQSVVVFWNDFEAKEVLSNEVVFVHGDGLVEWLEKRPLKMTADKAARVVSHIEYVRPVERGAWWKRRLTFGIRGRNTAAASLTAGRVASEAGPTGGAAHGRLR
jgi:hypothetical protein